MPKEKMVSEWELEWLEKQMQRGLSRNAEGSYRCTYNIQNPWNMINCIHYVKTNREEPLMREIRYLDKLIDELAKGKGMDKILRHE